MRRSVITICIHVEDRNHTIQGVRSTARLSRTEVLCIEREYPFSELIHPHPSCTENLHKQRRRSKQHGMDRTLDERDRKLMRRHPPSNVNDTKKSVASSSARLSKIRDCLIMTVLILVKSMPVCTTPQNTALTSESIPYRRECTPCVTE